MVTVRVTETYDMKTTTDKIGIVGIHTPGMTLINKLYPGLVKNYKFIRFKKCDVVGACASVLPADPLQVGVTNGTVAPEDMFNPILYKAVTNDSFDSLVSRIYDSINTTDVLDRTGSINEQTIDAYGSADNFKIYYSLLSENGTWRKSMPQTGFRIRSLVPICHTLLSQYGNVHKPTNAVVSDATEALQSVPSNLADVPFIKPDLTGLPDNVVTSNSYVFRGKSVKMPRFPLHYTTESNVAVSNPPAPPKTFVACMIIPPAKLHEFYYRMRVTWTISFESLISTLHYAGISGGFAGVGESAHGTNYTYDTSKTALPNEESSVDTDSVDINKIMES